MCVHICEPFWPSGKALCNGQVDGLPCKWLGFDPGFVFFFFFFFFFFFLNNCSAAAIAEMCNQSFFFFFSMRIMC